MSKYNFDLEIDRNNTGSIKYDRERFGKPADIIPMWVADMDFRVVPEIIEALKKTADHGVFGYADTPVQYDVALCNWYRKRFNWNVMPGWNVKVPGVLFAVTGALRSLTKENDAVLIFQPVYHPFERIIKELNRELVVSELKFNQGKYEIDFESLEKDIINKNVKVLLFCSPHNPVGRVWTKEELENLGNICVKHNVYIISDEIHSDLVFSGYKHTMLASINDKIADITITCTAPTKTFNLAGLQAANTFVKNPEIKKLIQTECESTAYNHLNTMGAVAAQAAYTYGEEWLEELIAYLEGNAEYLDKSLKEMDAGISLVKPNGTYLMWLDCRGLGFSDPDLDDFFTNKAKIWLNTGISFGIGGSGFMRMNIACTRKTLQRAMDNLKKALGK